jgi:hypothetical protein
MAGSGTAVLAVCAGRVLGYWGTAGVQLLLGVFVESIAE